MSKLFDTFLSRTDPKQPATPEQLRQLAEIAQKESLRLTHLVQGVEKKLTHDGELQQSLDGVEKRLQETTEGLQKVDAQIKNFRALAQHTEALDTKVQSLNRLAKQADETIRDVEVRKAETDKAVSTMFEFMAAAKEAEAKLESIKGETVDLSRMDDELTRLHGRFDQFQSQLTLIGNAQGDLQKSAESLEVDSRSMEERTERMK